MFQHGFVNVHRLRQADRGCFVALDFGRCEPQVIELARNDFNMLVFQLPYVARAQKRVDHESNEPIHIHAQKGDIQVKYWLLIDEIEIKEAFSYNFTPVSKREIKKIIYQHFELIVSEWSKHFLNNGKDA
jgi:hypothetical protein